MLHVFAGVPRVGSFTDAGEALGVIVTSVDVAIGGLMHDVSHADVRAALLAEVLAGVYDVVWLGTPCASCSVLWLDGEHTPPRARHAPDGVDGLPAWQQEYLEKHNAFIEFSCELALAAWRAGATYVIENPPDFGRMASRFFQWGKRQHCPLWLTSPLRRLIAATRPLWASGCQCRLGGAFRKATTLLSGGPRAARLASFEQLDCTHVSHERVAYGLDADGRLNSAAAAAYPVAMCFWAVGTLFASAPVQAVGYADAPAMAGLSAAAERLQQLNLQAARRFVEAEGAPHGDDTEREDRLHDAKELAWRSTPERMPADWPEAGDMFAPKAQDARSAELRYISRRRAEAEDGEKLARRPFADPHPTPDLPAHAPRLRATWPAGAPARPIHIAQLYHPGIYASILAAIAVVSSDVAVCLRKLKSGSSAVMPKRETRIFKALESQPEWARQCLWDCADPDDCVPMQPYSEADPPAHQANSRFFSEWGRRLAWTDVDMIDQVTRSGVESRSTMEWDTTVMAHHGGLRNAPAPAEASITKDTAAGWMTAARTDLWTVPARLVPKNVVAQHKWLLLAGKLSKKLKYRVTTDDSIEPTSGGVTSDSRNNEIDREGWGNVPLTSPRTLGEAVAIVKSTALGMGITASAAALERIALWAIDLSDAYRALAVARTEHWQQCFVWAGGVKLDLRCVFGAAHMVDFFQRVSAFGLAVAQYRIREYDRQHPYSAEREEWRRWRESELGGEHPVDFSSIYIDDGSGLVPLAAGEPLTGAPPGAPPTAVGLGVEPARDGGTPRVRLRLYHDMSRPQIHLAIVRDTFMEAGWDIAVDKVQLGLSIENLGLAVSSEGEGCMFAPEAKRLGLIADIDAQLTEPSGEVQRTDVEKLVGRCSHIAQVACEGNAHLQPMYRFQNATWSTKATVGKSAQRVRPRWLQMQGKSATQHAYVEALGWWRQALVEGISAPLAPNTTFPAIGDPGVAFFFTDAAREALTGYGAYSTVEIGGEAIFLYHERRWAPDELRALQEDRFSMPAGECHGAVVFADALLSALHGVTHLYCFTDSDATARAFTTAGSGSPQLNVQMQWLLRRHPGVQLLGIHQAGVRNEAADRLSRTIAGRDKVLAEVKAAGLTSVEIQPPADDVAAMLSLAMASPQRAG